MTLAAVLVVSWDRGGGARRLVGAAAVLGIATGASWELAVILAVGLVAFVLASERSISRRTTAEALAAGVIIAAGILVFVVVRAGQNPAINWGQATSAGRLADLLRQKDFLTGAAAPSGVRALSSAPHRAIAYLHITVQELGLAAILVAIVGAVAVVRRRRLNDTLFFAIVIVGNLVGAIFVAGLEHDNGILSGMVVGGFLIDVVLVLGVLVALGTTWLGELASAVAARGHDGAAPATAARTRAIVGVVVALAILVPSIIVHEPYASHRGPAYADDYARRVLDALPQNAVLLTDGWEFGQPLRYLQIVRGERRDVSILSDAEAQTSWYRDELRRELPTIAPASNLPYTAYVPQFVANAQCRAPPRVRRHVDDRALQRRRAPTRRHGRRGDIRIGNHVVPADRRRVERVARCATARRLAPQRRSSFRGTFGLAVRGPGRHCAGQSRRDQRRDRHRPHATPRRGHDPPRHRREPCRIAIGRRERPRRPGRRTRPHRRRELSPRPTANYRVPAICRIDASVRESWVCASRRRPRSCAMSGRILIACWISVVAAPKSLVAA